jgi:hypothetical protein
MVEIHELIRIANEHGFIAQHNLSGGVDVHIPWTRGIEAGFNVVPVNNLRQLKIALGY